MPQCQQPLLQALPDQRNSSLVPGQENQHEGDDPQYQGCGVGASHIFLLSTRLHQTTEAGEIRVQDGPPWQKMPDLTSVKMRK